MNNTAEFHIITLLFLFPLQHNNIEAIFLNTFIAPYTSFESSGNQSQIQLKSLNKMFLGLGFFYQLLFNKFLK